MFAFIKTSIHILAALCLGVVVALAALQEDQWFKSKLQQSLQQSFEEILQVPVKCHVVYINLLSGKIVIDDISVQSAGQWAFECPRMSFEFSLFGLLARHQIEADLLWYNATAFTHLDEKSIALIEPLKLIMQAPSVVPFKLNRCSFKATTLNMFNLKNNTHTQLLFSSDSVFMQKSVKTTIAYADGSIKQDNRVYISKTAGTVVADIATEDLQVLALKTELSFYLPAVVPQPQRFLLTGSYKHNQGFLELYTADKKFSCKARNIRFNNSVLKADIHAVADIAQFWRFFGKKQAIVGKGSLEASLEIDGTQHTIAYTGQAVVENARYFSHALEFAQVSFNGDASSVRGAYQVQNLIGITGAGNWSASLKDFAIQVDCMTTQPIILGSGIIIKSGEAHSKAEFSDGVIKADYTVRCTKSNDDKVSVLSGSLKACDNNLLCAGTFDGYQYVLEGSLLPLKITVARYGVDHNKPVLEFKRNNETDILEGFIEYSFIKLAVNHFFGYELQGDGVLGVSVGYNRGHIRGALELHKGTLRIPGVYNMVTDITGKFTIDTRNRTVNMQDLAIVLHKGSLYSSRCSFYFKGNSLVSAHVPLVMDYCLVSLNKEFFGLMSGSLSMCYRREGISSLKGYIMLDDSHLRSNVLSSQVQKDFAGNAVKPLTAYTNESVLDLFIDTRQPIHVKTPFLDAQARLQAKVKGSVFHPEISGIIDLSEGTLAFAYKPLYITQAKIFISPDSLDDARIELTAKNKIKKYMVTLHVTGSVGQPTISFESTPTLQEEQIITLLLAGSQEGSLSLVMPTMIMHNLEDVLFGPAESASKLQRSVKGLLKPLKNIRIMPTLADQKGDIRGAVEIDINDRLRAAVQNNIMLSEDTQVEIEYTVSDDMSVRGIKDDQGNIGGEVEMRWKF